MADNLVITAYIVAAALFILSLAGLSNPETARRGNVFGIIGMLIALVATAARAEFTGYVPLLVAISWSRRCTASWALPRSWSASRR
jgi:NAD(P) transhydrogenase subunit beta